jgi:hypothetical protein
MARIEGLPIAGNQPRGVWVFHHAADCAKVNDPTFGPLAYPDPERPCTCEKEAEMQAAEWRKTPMKQRTVPILWYENDAGEKWYPPAEYNGFPIPPPGFDYQHFRNPCELRDSICTNQGELAAGTQTWNMTLVSHMTRPPLWIRLRQLLRCAWLPPLFELDEAIVLAATCCERCLNVLHYRYFTGDGYSFLSPEYLRCPTICEYCDGPGTRWEGPPTFRSKLSDVSPATQGDPPPGSPEDLVAHPWKADV